MVGRRERKKKRPTHKRHNRIDFGGTKGTRDWAREEGETRELEAMIKYIAGINFKLLKKEARLPGSDPLVSSGVERCAREHDVASASKQRSNNARPLRICNEFGVVRIE